MQRFVVTGLVPVFLAAAGGAQNQPIVTEADFLAALDSSHPAVVAGTEALAVARADLLAASTLDNPVAGIAREDPDGPVRQTDYLLSWQLPDAARGRTVAARERSLEAALAKNAQSLLELRLAMRAVYADWALAVARQERLAEQAARVQSLSAREAERTARGESSALEAQRLALASAALRSQAALAASAAVHARAAAAAWNPSLPADAVPALPEVAAPPPLDAPHPNVRAAEAELAAAQLQAGAARRFVSSPELTLGWQRQESDASSIDGPVLGIGWALPLFDRKRAERSAAEARIAAAGAHLELVERETAAFRASAASVFERLANELDASSATLAASERALDGAEAAFRLGETSVTDLLDTHRTVTDAALAALDLRAAALAAMRELERLAGAGEPSFKSANPFNTEQRP